MELNSITILALIFITLVIIKIIVVSISPKSWFNFAKKLYINPKLTSIFSLILALLVLYLIVNSGITIVEILAVSLFLSLLIMIGISQYAEELLNWKEEKKLNKILKNQWLYILVWLILIIWGIKEILAS